MYEILVYEKGTGMYKCTLTCFRGQSLEYALERFVMECGHSCLVRKYEGWMEFDKEKERERIRKVLDICQKKWMNQEKIGG